ncbi:MAG TPA: AAA family ATPase, partial [Telluria sp.]
MILTRPAERLAGAARVSIELGCDAIWVEGKGRVGKTFGCRQLVQSEAWRPFPMYMAEFTYGQPTKPTEGYFMASLLEQMGQTVPVSAGSNLLATRLVRLLHEQRHKRSAEIIGLVINEANRFTSEDYEHVVTISNEIEKTSRAFFLLINQSDAGRLGTGDTDSRPPPHVYGRFFTNSHHYTGLLWDVPAHESEQHTLSDVALAFQEYDDELTWPQGSGISYTRHFAPEAWADGWRL